MKFLPVLYQIIGFIGSGFLMFSYQFKTKKGILASQMTGQGLVCLHYLLIGGYTGAAVNVIGLLRNFVYGSKGKWAKNRIWVAVFTALFIASGIVTWKDMTSILPLIPMILASVGYFSDNERVIRIVSLIGAPCWLIYAVFAGSVAETVMESIGLVSVGVSVIRYDILKKKKSVNDENK